MRYRIPPISAEYFQLPFIGDKDYLVGNVSSLDSADYESIIFFSGSNEETLCSLSAGIVIANNSFSGRSLKHKARALVFSEKPKFTFLGLLESFFSDSFAEESAMNPDFSQSKVSSASVIEPGVAIGEGSEIFPNVYIAGNVKLGRKCIVRAGSVLGCAGLGDLWHGGRYNRFMHLGAVIIDDNVTIGTNVSVARGMLEDTRIGAGTRIANNVNIGHSVVIGKNCYISSGVTIGGACVIEDGAWLSVGCVLTDHIRIGESAMVGAGAVILKDAHANTLYLGNPARAVSERRHQ